MNSLPWLLPLITAFVSMGPNKNTAVSQVTAVNFKEESMRSAIRLCVVALLLLVGGAVHARAGVPMPVPWPPSAILGR